MNKKCNLTIIGIIIQTVLFGINDSSGNAPTPEQRQHELALSIQLIIKAIAAKVICEPSFVGKQVQADDLKKYLYSNPGELYVQNFQDSPLISLPFLEIWDEKGNVKLTKYNLGNYPAQDVPFYTRIEVIVKNNNLPTNIIPIVFVMGDNLPENCHLNTLQSNTTTSEQKPDCSFFDNKKTVPETEMLILGKWTYEEGVPFNKDTGEFHLSGPGKAFSAGSDYFNADHTCRVLSRSSSFEGDTVQQCPWEVVDHGSYKSLRIKLESDDWIEERIVILNSKTMVTTLVDAKGNCRFENSGNVYIRQ